MKNKKLVNSDNMLNSTNTRFSKDELVFLFKRNIVLSKLKNSKKDKLSIIDLKGVIEPRKTPTGRNERNYERSLRIILDYLFGVSFEKTSDREKVSLIVIEETLRAYGLKFLKEEKEFFNKLIEKKRVIKNSVNTVSNTNLSKISEDTGYSQSEVLEVINEEIMSKVESTSEVIKSNLKVSEKSSIFNDTSFLNSNFLNAETSLRNSEFESEKNEEIIKASETRKLNKKLFEKDNFDLTSLDDYELSLLDSEIEKSESRFNKLDDYVYSFEKYLLLCESNIESVLNSDVDFLSSDLSLELSLLKSDSFKSLIINDLLSGVEIEGANIEIRSRLISDFKRNYFVNFSRKLKLKGNFVSKGSDFIESDEGEEGVYTNILKALDVIPEDSQLNLKNNLSKESVSKIDSLKSSGRLIDCFILEGNDLEVEELSSLNYDLVSSDVSFTSSVSYKNSLSNAIKDGGHFILDAGNSVLVLNSDCNFPSYLIRGRNLVLLKHESGLSDVERLSIRFSDCQVYDSVLSNLSELNTSLGLELDSNFLSLKGVNLIADINSEISVLPLLSETRSERTFLLFLRLALKYSAETYGIEDFSSDSYLTSKYLLPIDIIIMKAINEMYSRESISLTELSSRFCISPYLASHVLNGSISREDFRVNYFSNISSFMSSSNNIESRN